MVQSDEKKAKSFSKEQLIFNIQHNIFAKFIVTNRCEWRTFEYLTHNLTSFFCNTYEQHFIVSTNWLTLPNATTEWDQKSYKIKLIVLNRVTQFNVEN